jgi:hypothetical protein
MRKIKITKEFEDYVKNFNKNLFVSTRNKNFESPIRRLNKLFKELKPKYKQHKEYVQKIIDEYPRILNASPEEMEILIFEFDKILTNNHLALTIRKNKNISFHEAVVYALRYEDLREKEFLQFLNFIDIKTCVYCNLQSTLVIEPKYYNKKKKAVKKTLAKLQLDHFHPKSQYPFLATSLFNLYPTCANCNLAKGNKKSLFKLYTTTADLDVFNFRLSDKSVLRYWLSLKKENLDVSFNCSDQKLLKNHNDLFQIQALYDTQMDVAEELLLKAKANPKIYRKILQKEFGQLFKDPSIIDRLLLGNYSKPDDINRRPMAKYSQDIAKQLKLIS